MSVTFESLCCSHGIASNSTATTLHVDKTNRTLSLLVDGTCLLEIPVIVGRSPVGSKQREGDLRTPEGHYVICYRNPASRFHLFLGLSYPNHDDARQGLAQGIIDQATCDSICQALDAGECPDWYTPLGGEVGIHGGGIDREGTQGCIAMDNHHIELLWEATVIGTQVTITA